MAGICHLESIQGETLQIASSQFFIFHTTTCIYEEL